MADRSKEDPRTLRNRLIWEDSAAWIGRIFAIMIFMIGPGVAGVWLDRQFGTKFLAAVGIVLGMVLGTYVLLILVSVKRPGLDDENADGGKATREGKTAVDDEHTGKINRGERHSGGPPSSS